MTNPVRTLENAVTTLVNAAFSPPGSLISDVDRMQFVRERTLDILSGLSEAQGTWSPRPGVWSTAQIADHLLRSDELYRTQFARLIQLAKDGKDSAIDISLREIDTTLTIVPLSVMQFFEAPVRMFNFFVPNALRETIIRHPVMPALNPKASEPRQDLSIEKLRTDMAGSLVELEKILRAPMPANIDRPVIVHALLGRDNLQQLLRILVAHEERHQDQMTQLRANANFPSS